MKHIKLFETHITDENLKEITDISNERLLPFIDIGANVTTEIFRFSNVELDRYQVILDFNGLKTISLEDIDDLVSFDNDIKSKGYSLNSITVQIPNRQQRNDFKNNQFLELINPVTFNLEFNIKLNSLTEIENRDILKIKFYYK